MHPIGSMDGVFTFIAVVIHGSMTTCPRAAGEADDPEEPEEVRAFRIAGRDGSGTNPENSPKKVAEVSGEFSHLREI